MPEMTPTAASGIMTASATALLPGFSDPVHDSQRTFRALLDAMSRPGSIVPLPLVPRLPEDVPGSALAVLLTLADLDTPVWLDGFYEEGQTERIVSWLSFNCGCPRAATPREAVFALFAAGERRELDPALLADLTPGTPEYPDRGATLLVAVPGLGEDAAASCAARIAGPGVRDSVLVRVPGAGARFWEYITGQEELFPLGLDVIFAGPGEVLCLPRSSRVLEIICT